MSHAHGADPDRIRSPWVRDPKLPSGQRVNELWAYCSVDPADGDEGVMAIPTQFGMLPLVAADRERVTCYREFAVALARQSGNPVHLYHFSQRSIEDVIEP